MMVFLFGIKTNNWKKKLEWKITQTKYENCLTQKSFVGNLDMKNLAKIRSKMKCIKFTYYKIFNFIFSVWSLIVLINQDQILDFYAKTVQTIKKSTWLETLKMWPFYCDFNAKQ